MPPAANPSGSATALTDWPAEPRPPLPHRSRTIGPGKFAWPAAAAPAGAAVATGIAIAVGPAPAVVRHPPARLEQTITDRSAMLNETIAFSPNGILIAATSFDSTMVINLDTGARQVFAQRTNGGNVNNAVFSPDSRTLVVTAAANNRADMRMWGLPAGKPAATPPYSQHRGVFDQVTYNPSGTILATGKLNAGRWGSATYLWSVANRRVIAVLSFRDGGDSPLAFSPDGQTLALGDNTTGQGPAGDGKIRLWNVRTRTVQGALIDPGRRAIGLIAYSPDGKMLAATDGTHIYVWDVARRKLLTVIPGPRHQALFSLAFSPDGRSVAAAGNGLSAYVWDAATGKTTAVFRDPSGEETSSLAYSPDGRTLAVLDYGGHIYLWNVSALR